MPDTGSNNGQIFQTVSCYMVFFRMVYAEIIANKPLLCFMISVEKVHINRDAVRTELLVPWRVPLQFMPTQRRLCTSLDVRMLVSIGDLLFSVSSSFSLLQPVMLCCLLTYCWKFISCYTMPWQVVRVLNSCCLHCVYNVWLQSWC